MSFTQRMIEHYRSRRFAYLFFSLLVTMVASPVFAELGLNNRYIEFFLTLNILAAALVSLFTFRPWLGWGTLGLFFAARGSYAFLEYEHLLSTSRGAGAAVCFLAVLGMLRFLLKDGRVTSERIFSALSVYLMIGIMSGFIFSVFEETWPGSIGFQDLPADADRKALLARTIYFSFVTLGTVGYGDITPLSGPARALAVTLAIVGQLYLTVVVARLVSLYQGRAHRGD